MPKRKRNQLLDWLTLPPEIWREIFFYVASGYFLALWRRIRPVCRLFKAIVKDDRLLRTVSKYETWTIQEYSILQWMDVWVNRKGETPSTLWAKLVSFGLDDPKLYGADIKNMLILDWTDTDSPKRETVGDHTRPTFESETLHKAQIHEFCDYWKKKISPEAMAVFVTIRPSTGVYWSCCDSCLKKKYPEGRGSSVRVKACLPSYHAEWTGYQTVKELYDGILGFSDHNPYQYPIVLLLHRNKRRGSRCRVEGMTLGELLNAGGRISKRVARVVAQAYQEIEALPDTENSISL